MLLFTAALEQIGEELIATSDGRTPHKVVRVAGISKRATCHRFGHSFATHQLSDGYDIRTVQELMGHKDVRTTMMNTHALRSGLGVRSPLDVPSGGGGGGGVMRGR